MKVERSLVLELSRREVLVGRPITVRVSDDGNRPVEGALVEAGSKRARTDARGRCELTFYSPGFWKIVAVKPSSERVSYESTARLVRALPRSTTARTSPRVSSRIR